MTKRTCTVDGCLKVHYGRGWCRFHYQRAYLSGNLEAGPRTLAPATASLDERLRNIGWTTTTQGCWEWKGSLNPNGYGQMAVGREHATTPGKPWIASRAAYTAWRGGIPTGMYVCHTCDNPPCINPAHLFLGSPSDNAQDMADKQRSQIGETSSQAKFTDAQCEQVRELRMRGMTYDAIGKHLGMTRHHASLIYRGLRRGRPTPARGAAARP